MRIPKSSASLSVHIEGAEAVSVCRMPDLPQFHNLHVQAPPPSRDFVPLYSSH